MTLAAAMSLSASLSPASTDPPASVPGPAPSSRAAAPLLAARSGELGKRHTKSRTGCRTCKRRKIKCDEHRPSCRNCVRHAVKCDFLHGLHPGGAAQAYSPNGLAGADSSAAAPSSSASSTVPLVPDAVPPLNVLDLELMHNFATSTYATLSSAREIRDLWRLTVVRLALRCDYLLRSVLAVSALHLASHRRDPERRRLVEAAVSYHRVAARSAMALMHGEVEGENAERLYLFSVLTFYFALASPRNPQDHSLVMGESAFPDWIFLLRGSRRLIDSIKPETYAGPLLPMFTHGRARFLAMMRPASDLPPSLLRDLARRVSGSSAVRERPHLGPIYSMAIQELRKALARFLIDQEEEEDEERRNGSGSGGGADGIGGAASWARAWEPVDITDAFVWQFLVAEDFLPLLREPPEQEAVAIFAHFFILLKRLDSHWWLQGWADDLVSRAWHVLDQDHRLWIQWPIEELGWVPPST